MATGSAAEASYAEAIKLNPSNGAALRSYGLMLALESRYAEALATRRTCARVGSVVPWHQ